MTATFPNLDLRYEIFPVGDGWCWRCVAAGGEILARALRPMSHEVCRMKVNSLRSTLAAPLLCLTE